MNTRIFNVLAVAVLLAAGCGKEAGMPDNNNQDDPQNGQPAGGKVSLTASVASGTQTKVFFDKEGNLYWNVDDVIGVSSKDSAGFTPFYMDDQEKGTYAGKQKALFVGEMTGEFGEYAVYPYNANHRISGDELTYHLPSEYSYNGADAYYYGSDKSANPPAYGWITSSSVIFKHLGGVIAIRVKNLIGPEGTVTIAADRQICGDFTADLTRNHPVIVAPSAAAASSLNTVTIKYTGITPGDDGVFFFPVPCGTFNLSVTVASGVSVEGKKNLQLYEYSTATNEVTIERGTIKLVLVSPSFSKVENRYLVNGHKFVDLGLSSGLLWAETNVGAAGKADRGDFYAWGEIETKATYYGSNYKFGGYASQYSKYTKEDGRSVLEAEDDAASVHWGTGCRIPTADEVNEMVAACQRGRVTEKASDGNEKEGYLFVSKSNSCSIFLVAGGWAYWDKVYTDPADGTHYQTSSLNTAYYNDQNLSYYFWGVREGIQENNRYIGCLVRPVADN